MTVTATIKLTTSIITIISAPKVPIHKEHVGFFFSPSTYKEIHRMILYTTYNKYCVSYILLFERMCVGFFFLFLPFSQFPFFPGLWIFFSFTLLLLMSLSQSSQGLEGGGGGHDGRGCFRHKAGLLMSLPPPAPLSPPPPRDAGGCGASFAPYTLSGLWP